MTKKIAGILALAACSMGMLLAQKQPKPKSQKEVDALMAIQNATTPQARLAAIDNLLVRNRVVLTNKTPTGLVRGFGGPQVYFALERLIQRIALELKLDVLDVYRRNFVAADAFPYRAAAGALLQGWGCRTLSARSADEALTLSGNEPVPALLLLDYRLGETLGPDLLPLLFGRWQRPVPVIVVSAERDEALRAQAREAGWGYLPKPIRPAALRALMTQMLMRGTQEIA